jgi:hypothetical protein
MSVDHRRAPRRWDQFSPSASGFGVEVVHHHRQLSILEL